MEHQPDASSSRLTVAELKQSFGWTDRLIRKVLGDPDDVRRGTRQKVRLYARDRVEAAMARKDVREQLEHAARSRETRSAAARKAANRRKEALIRWVKIVGIEWMPHTPRTAQRAIRAGMKQRVEERALRGSFGDPLGPVEDPERRKALARAYLRHHCTNYEQIYSELVGKAGHDRAYVLLRRRVDAMVVQRFPSLRGTHGWQGGR